MRLAALSRLVLGESCEITGVAPQLGSNTVIGMSSNGERQDHHARSHSTNQGDDLFSRRLIVG